MLSPLVDVLLPYKQIIWQYGTRIHIIFTSSWVEHELAATLIRTTFLLFVLSQNIRKICKTAICYKHQQCVCIHLKCTCVKKVHFTYASEYWGYPMLLCSVDIQSCKLGSLRSEPYSFYKCLTRDTYDRGVARFSKDTAQSCEILDYIQHIRNNWAVSFII